MKKESKGRRITLRGISKGRVRLLGQSFGIVLRQIGRDANPQSHVLMDTSVKECCRLAHLRATTHLIGRNAAFSDQQVGLIGLVGLNLPRRRFLSTSAD